MTTKNLNNKIIKIVFLFIMIVTIAFTSINIYPNKVKAQTESGSGNGITVTITTPDSFVRKGASFTLTMRIENESNANSGDQFTMDMSYESNKAYLSTFDVNYTTRDELDYNYNVYLKCNGGTGCSNGDWKFDFTMPNIGSSITRTMSFIATNDSDVVWGARTYEAIIYPKNTSNYESYVSGEVYVHGDLPDSVTVSSRKVSGFGGIGVGAFASLRGSDNRLYTIDMSTSIEGWNGSNYSSTSKSFLRFAGESTITRNGNTTFQAAKTSENKIVTRTMKNLQEWTPWVENGATSGEVSMETFNGMVYQAVKALNSTDIYTRSSIDGIVWSPWVANGKTPGNISMKVFNGRLYQSVRGATDNTIYTRYTNNGYQWYPWTANGKTPIDIEMEVFNGRLYQSVKGNSSTDIYTRYTVNGSDWTAWKADGRTPGAIELARLGNRLYQTVRGGDNKIYTRYTIDGNNWYPWEAFVTTNKDVTLSSDGEFMTQIYVNGSGKPYQRIMGTFDYEWSDPELLTW